MIRVFRKSCKGSSERGRGLACALLAAGSALFMAAMPAAAQDVGGVVISSGTRQPLPGAQVLMIGTRQGTITGSDGRFVLRNVREPNVTLQVTMIGYRTATRTVAAGTLNVEIALAQTAVALDELVVTGTAQAEQKRSLGNVVSTVDAAGLMAKAPVQDVNQLLNGHVAGVTVLGATGQVGGSTRVRIRGASSFSLIRPPLVYVDGVRVNNEDQAGPASAQGFGSRPISRWNDLNPDEIESIQVIKGPAAATLYGTEAASGVIQIITKRGGGAPRFSFRTQQGANWFANPAGRLWTNYGLVNGTLQSIDYTQLKGLWQTAQDSMGINEPIFRTGQLQTYDVSVSGGTGIVDYFIAGGFEHNNGIERTNRKRRGSGRLNVTVTPSEKWSVQGNFGYVNGRYDLSCEQGCGGVTWTTFYATPAKINTPRHGFWSGTPQSYHSLYAQWEDLVRFTGGVTLKYNPYRWLSNRVTFGTDQTREGDNFVMNHDQRFLFFDSFADRGYRGVTARNINYTTLDYAGTATITMRPDVTASTSVGAQYYRKHTDFVSAYGEGFPVPGLTSLAATTQNRTGTQDYVNNTTVGIFAQEQLAWLNRRFLTVGLRADDNSAFGANFDLIYYPKVSAAWVLSDEPFFRFSALNTLRLRAAYGQSGQQPNAFDAIRTYAPVTGPNDVGTVTPQAVGNPDLGPERSGELEAGFDAAFLNDRMGIEFTYYNRQTTNAILLKQIAPSTGFSGSTFVNAGKIANHGLEALVHGTPYVSQKLNWEVSFNIGSNSNKVVSLGDVTSADFIVPATYVQHHIGYPVGAWWEKKIVSADLGTNGVATNIMCDNGSGGSVDCASAPAVYLARTTPKIEGGVNTTLTILSNLKLYAQVDFKTGYSKLDGNERVRCWFWKECPENFPTLWQGAALDPAKVAGYQKGFASGLIHDASFTKLRQVSATYTLPASMTNRVGMRGASITVAGRNLHTWTKYRGLEPEATFNGGARGTFGDWEQDVVPQLRQFVTTINVNF